MNRRFLRPALVLSAVFAVFGAAAGLTAAAPQADRAAPQAPAAPYQGQTCSWVNFGSVARGHAHSASAYNSDNNTIYNYGGIGNNNNPEGDVNQIHFPDAMIGNATHGPVAGANAAKDFFGASGAYRNMMVWWVGGGEASGDGTNNVQTLDLTGMSPSWNGNVAVSGAFNDRLFAAAAYDPDHDVIVVNGGADLCDAATRTDVTPPLPVCTAGNFTGSSVMTFDAMGVPSWDRLAGGPNRLYGHTMVYDSTQKRLIVFGGTEDGARGRSGVQYLDVADPDWTKAAWKTLATTGTAPADRFFHSAAYDPAGNRMIVYGGVRSNAFAGNESAASDTFALDLGASPAVWTNLSASEASSAVGSVMQYDTATGKVILHGGRRQASDNTTGNSYYLNCTVDVATNTPVATVPRATNTPGTPGRPTPPPQETANPLGGQCDWLNGRVPGAAINAALANQANVYGYNMLCYPSRPPGPYNGLRTKLSLRNPGVPYHPVYNGLVFKCGCP